jgi:hypothetical protein
MVNQMECCSQPFQLCITEVYSIKDTLLWKHVWEPCQIHSSIQQLRFIVKLYIFSYLQCQLTKNGFVLYLELLIKWLHMLHPLRGRQQRSWFAFSGLRHARHLLFTSAMYFIESGLPIQETFLQGNFSIHRLFTTPATNPGLVTSSPSVIGTKTYSRVAVVTNLASTIF